MDLVYLVAKSGGAGVVVKALELIEEKQVERAILLAPALSPDYDLSRALARSAMRWLFSGPRLMCSCWEWERRYSERLIVCELVRRD